MLVFLSFVTVTIFPTSTVKQFAYCATITTVTGQGMGWGGGEVGRRHFCWSCRATKIVVEIKCLTGLTSADDSCTMSATVTTVKWVSLFSPWTCLPHTLCLSDVATPIYVACIFERWQVAWKSCMRKVCALLIAPGLPHLLGGINMPQRQRMQLGRNH